MMHCRQCRSLSCESAGARALWIVGARAHARWAPGLWRRRRPWYCDCACGIPAQEWDGWGVCDGGCLITALIAWALLSFRLSVRGQAVLLLACSLVAREE